MSAHGEPNPDDASMPSEEELRAAYEDQLRRVTAVDAILQAAVTLVNIAGIRLGIGPADEIGGSGDRDLQQAQDAIDAVRGLMPVLERRVADEVRPLRDALSQIQIAFTQEIQREGAARPAAPSAGAPAGEGDSLPQTPGGPSASPDERIRPKTRPQEDESAVSSGRLWVPGR